MRQQSDAIRGLRWGAMAVTLGLAAVVVVRLADQSPSAQASAEQSLPEPQRLALTAGPGAPRLASSSEGVPPQVPPPPPPAGWKPLVRTPRTFVMPAAEPEPQPMPELRPPIILGLDQDAGVDAEPLTQITVVAMRAPEPEPLRPVIINHAKLHRRDHPAMRLVKTVGRVLGIGD